MKDQRDAMDNWEKNAITAELEITDKINVRQTKLGCPWCDRRHIVIVDRYRQASGVMICQGCGQFFRWTVHKELDIAHTKRARPRRFKKEATNVST